MGKFKDYLTGKSPNQRFFALFEGASIGGYKLNYTDKMSKPAKFHSFDTLGLSASIKTGAEVDSYVSKSAVGLGAGAGLVLFGPLGALAGGLIGSAKRKGGTQIYVTIEKDGQPIGIIPGPAKKEREAMAFIAAINGSAAERASQEAEAV